MLVKSVLDQEFVGFGVVMWSVGFEIILVGDGSFDGMGRGCMVVFL